MKIIALTGGIGSGKSTVAAIMKDLGAVVIDSDKVASEVRDTSALKEVIEAFGQNILTPQGYVDRKKLAQLVFSDRQALAKLNKIVHTKLELEIDKRLKRYEEQGTDIVVIEIALISEAPWVQRADYIWVVKSSREIILKRLRERGMSDSESLARMSAQAPAEEKVKVPLIIISNDGNVEDLKGKVVKLWKDIHNNE